MKTVICIMGLVGMLSGAVLANPGDQWILPLELQGGGWTTYPGAGYGGADAYGANTMDGVRRAYWKTSDPAGNGMPSTTELYSIEWWRPTSGAVDWQPIESQFNGSAGETYPIEPNIPWVGAFGTNHQYIGAENGTPGAWVSTGPGPHTPETADYNSGANGTVMWLTHGSWLYAKWDFPWAINHTWSAIRLTQITPEPASLLLLGLGGLLLRKRNAA